MRHLGSTWIGLLGTVLTLLHAAAGADSQAPVRVDRHGQIILEVPTVLRTSATSATPRQRVFDFGLPASPPLGRWWEAEQLPIANAQWATNGIHYTQILFLTRLNPGDLLSATGLPHDTILVVRIVGANQTNEYTEASAAFEIRAPDRPFELAWRDGSVVRPGDPDGTVQAVIDIPASGIHRATGSRLEFRASMPPGTSGSMTVKIPLDPQLSAGDLERLQNLDFDEECRRLRRYWSDRAREGQSRPTLVMWTPE